MDLAKKVLAGEDGAEPRIVTEETTFDQEQATRRCPTASTEPTPRTPRPTASAPAPAGPRPAGHPAAATDADGPIADDAHRRRA